MATTVPAEVLAARPRPPAEEVSQPGRRLRRAAVAGYFYPAQPGELEQAVARVIPAGTAQAAALAAILPHGSFQQCGAVVGATIARVRVPRRCIIIGPSHTGTSMPWSLMASGSYQTPLGDVAVDAAMAEALLQHCPFIEADPWSQRGEHAVEVLLPFLQWRGPGELEITPLIGVSDREEDVRAVGHALAQLVRSAGEPVLLIASVDLSQYRAAADGQAQDRRLIDALCRLDRQQMLSEIREARIAMCGDTAASVILEASRALGASTGSLAAYGSSAEAGGDPDSATGYAGIVIQ